MCVWVWSGEPLNTRMDFMFSTLWWMNSRQGQESVGEAPPWGAGPNLWGTIRGKEKFCQIPVNHVGQDSISADVWHWFSVSCLLQITCLDPAAGINIDSRHSYICMGGLPLHVNLAIRPVERCDQGGGILFKLRNSTLFSPLSPFTSFFLMSPLRLLFLLCHFMSCRHGLADTRQIKYWSKPQNSVTFWQVYFW